MSDLLDVQGLAAQLDAVASRASVGVDGEALLQQARRVLTKVREAPVVAAQPDSPDAAAWYAIGGRDDVTCWREDVKATLYASWNADRLHIVVVAVDGEAWGMRITSTGTSYVSPGEGIEGPADRRILERMTRQLREARQRAAREVAARIRVCPKCGWVNRAGERGCAFCGVGGVPWAQDARVTERLTAQQVPQTSQLPLQAEPETTALSQAPGTLPLFDIDPAMLRAPHDVRGNVVINRVHPDRKANVAQAAADACEQAGLGRPPAQWIVDQLDRLPMLLCRNVSVDQAADIQRRLADAGASTSFEVGHG